MLAEGLSWHELLGVFFFSFCGSFFWNKHLFVPVKKSWVFFCDLEVLSGDVFEPFQKDWSKGVHGWKNGNC